ncbi:MAG: S-methyl-5'-thioadenosine phosphorylase [Anaerolineales bacterium]|nr:S-methyl-5'-thioadenosine phosphorylase [Anaerolineales bacterium]
MVDRPIIGIIGGSGLYQMQGLKNVRTEWTDTPFGKPSAPIVLGSLQGRRVAFLARHGIGHTLMPSEINYRANIYAMKVLGVDRILAVSACGSLREDFEPGHLVVPDQLFDNTRQRSRSFFGEGMVMHASMADPFCPEISARVADSIMAAGGVVHRTGTFITIEGPAFSTRAESNTYRSWGMSIIGMTTSPEAYLAREAQLCYGVMAHVTDYDVWRVAEEPVSVELVVRRLRRNMELAEKAIALLVANLPMKKDCSCNIAMKGALITAAGAIPEDTRRRLEGLLDGVVD